MEHQKQQPCWNVMAWTLFGMIGVLLVIGLLGGFDTTTAIAAR
ncbi:hypothetical protein GGD81_000563 [Rhodobium orientis]|nr:hypothetical protein [Rhodobium orientis]MBB4301546.1 hypothetical protein [Rhodobium orientis]